MTSKQDYKAARDRLAAAEDAAVPPLTRAQARALHAHHAEVEAAEQAMIDSKEAESPTVPDRENWSEAMRRAVLPMVYVERDDGPAIGWVAREKAAETAIQEAALASMSPEEAEVARGRIAERDAQHAETHARMQRVREVLGIDYYTPLPAPPRLVDPSERRERPGQEWIERQVRGHEQTRRAIDEGLEHQREEWKRNPPPLSEKQVQTLRWAFSGPPTPDHQINRWAVTLTCGHAVEARMNVDKREGPSGLDEYECSACGAMRMPVRTDLLGLAGPPPGQPKPVDPEVAAALAAVDEAKKRLAAARRAERARKAGR